MIPEEKVKFVVGLSNGENLTEGKGILLVETSKISKRQWIKDYFHVSLL